LEIEAFMSYSIHSWLSERPPNRAMALVGRGQHALAMTWRTLPLFLRYEISAAT
jgi:hypothetical protein